MLLVLIFHDWINLKCTQMKSTYCPFSAFATIYLSTTIADACSKLSQGFVIFLLSSLAYVTFRLLCKLLITGEPYRHSYLENHHPEQFRSQKLISTVRSSTAHPAPDIILYIPSHFKVPRCYIRLWHLSSGESDFLVGQTLNSLYFWLE